MLCDFHCHYFGETEIEKVIKSSEKISISFYKRADFEWFLSSKFINNSNIKITVGAHPWYLDYNFFEYIKSFLSTKDGKNIRKVVSGIGEIGFDFVKGDFFNEKDKQEDFFLKQIDLALKNDLPVIIHNVKGFPFFVKHVNLLKKLNACVFHGFSGSYEQGMFFLNHGVNAYFSFGNNILKNHSKSIECLKKLPLTNIGLETDSENGKMIEISNVYKKAMEVRNIEKQENINNFILQLQTNFDFIFT